MQKNATNGVVRNSKVELITQYGAKLAHKMFNFHLLNEVFSHLFRHRLKNESDLVKRGRESEVYLPV